MAAVSYRDRRLGTANVLEVNEWGHVLTWAFQVMPVFFTLMCRVRPSRGV